MNNTLQSFNLISPFAITDRLNFGASTQERTVIIDNSQIKCSHCMLFCQKGVENDDHNWTKFSRIILGCHSLQTEILFPSYIYEYPEILFVVSSQCKISKLQNNQKIFLIQINWDDSHDLAHFENILLKKNETQLVILCQIFEKIRDPRLVLRILRRFLKQQISNRLIISFITNQLLENELPKNYYRYWNVNQFTIFLLSAGFEIINHQHNTLKNDENLSIVFNQFEIACTQFNYNNFLLNYQLLPNSSILFLIDEKTESGQNFLNYSHSKNLLNNSSIPLILSVWDQNQTNILSVSAWSGCELRIENISELILAALFQIIFIYDEVIYLICWDDTGIFFRIAQAKQAGLIPPNIQLIVLCKGTHFFQETLNKTFQSPVTNFIQVQEKITIELADIIWYPSEQIQNYYEKTFGLQPLGHSIQQNFPEVFNLNILNIFLHKYIFINFNFLFNIKNHSPVTVIVPVYNRPFNEIEDLILGINSQNLLPKEVIFVDDKSEQDFATQYAEIIYSQLKIPARFICHIINRGLAAARNTGIFATETEFVAVHDSDNIACSNFLYRGCQILNNNPRIDAVTYWLQSFQDGEDWTLNDNNRQHYRPYSDGLIISLAANYLGDAMAIYRVASLRALGGWDESDRSMWEDWALFLKMLNSGMRLLNVPQVEVMYRVRSDSMLRTYPEYEARLRLVRALSGLPRLEALCLQRIILAPQINTTQENNNWIDLLIKAARIFLQEKPRLLLILRWLKQKLFNSLFKKINKF